MIKTMKHLNIKLLVAAGLLSVASFGAAHMVQAQDTTTNTVAAASKPIPYPLDYCVVSGDKLGGDMGDPVTFIYTNNGYNQEIKFCCSMCQPKFMKNPDKYLKIIQAAEAAQKK
jgi:hypothetical protein